MNISEAVSALDIAMQASPGESRPEYDPGPPCDELFRCLESGEHVSDFVMVSMSQEMRRALLYSMLAGLKRYGFISQTKPLKTR